MPTFPRTCALLLLAIAVIGLTGNTAQADPTYCPQGIVGQWNGVWWHWCDVCDPTKVGNAYASDIRMHGLGENCAKIVDPCNRYMRAPLTWYALGTHEPVRNGMSVNQQAKQKKYVPRQKMGGQAGQSDSDVAEDSFLRGSPLFTLADDHMVLVKDKGNNARYFRLLTVNPNAWVPSGFPIGVGQELEDGTGITEELDCDFSFDQLTHHVLKPKDGGPKRWHVTSFKIFFKKP